MPSKRLSGSRQYPSAPSAQTCDNQWHSVALRGTQWRSVALSGTQWHSVALSGTQWHSVHEHAERADIEEQPERGNQR